MSAPATKTIERPMRLLGHDLAAFLQTGYFQCKSCDHVWQPDEREEQTCPRCRYEFHEWNPPMGEKA